MSYTPHQQRVVDEKRELGLKIKGLDTFITSNAMFITLSKTEQDLMTAQRAMMKAYSTILSARISLF
jgi:hypothetical protein